MPYPNRKVIAAENPLERKDRLCNNRNKPKSHRQTQWPFEYVSAKESNNRFLFLLLVVDMCHSRVLPEQRVSERHRQHKNGTCSYMTAFDNFHSLPYRPMTDLPQLRNHLQLRQSIPLEGNMLQKRALFHFTFFVRLTASDDSPL